MGTESEAQMGFAFTFEVQFHWVFENRFVKVSRMHYRVDAIILFDCHATDLYIFGRNSYPGSGTCGNDSEKFFDGAWKDLAVIFEVVEAFWIMGEPVKNASDDGCCRVVPSGQQ